MSHTPQDCNGGHGCGNVEGNLDCACPCHFTKGEIRRARKAGRVRDWTIERDVRGQVRTRTRREEARHEQAMDRWARRYDALNGAPESDDDR